MFGSPIFLWLALFAVFLIVEAGTVALVSIWFALGALAALVSCALGAEMWLQITVFLVVSLVLLAVLWKRVRNKLTATKTNVDFFDMMRRGG